MIISLVLAYLFFGGSSVLALQGHSPADFEKAIKHVVLDEGSKKAALAELDLWDKSLKVQDKAASKDHEALAKSLRHRDTTRASVDQVDADLDETFREMDSNFLDTRFRVKGFTTKEEWTELAARLNKH
jgi:hypothetical protein